MEETVSQLRPDIVRMVKDASVLQYLVPAIIQQDVGQRLKRLYRISPERANHQMLDLMYMSTEPGKWTAFVQALEQAEYTDLANRLSSKSSRPFSTHSQLIALFSPQLEQTLNPEELLPCLISKDLITAKDKEEISARQRNEGRIMATVLLLERIQIHLDPDDWYTRFLQVLHENNYDDTIAVLDPDFDINTGAFNHTKDKSAGKGQEVYDADMDVAILQSIKEFREEIATLISVTDIVSHLESSGLDQDKASTLRDLDASEQHKAAYKLIDILMETAPSIRHAFVDCLEHTDYQYLSKLLSDSLYHNYCIYLRKLISIFEPTIQQMIDPADIVSHLVSEGVINLKDKGRILAKRTLHGKIAAAMMLLDSIQCRLEPHNWYTKLLQVLVNTDNCDVVRILEPDYLDDPEKFTHKICKEAAGTDDDTKFPNSDDDMSNKPLEHHRSVISKSVTAAQEHLQIFEKSVYNARQRVLEERHAKEQSIAHMRKVFETTVATERQKIMDYITRLTTEVDRSRHRPSTSVQFSLDNDSIPEGLTGKITFTPNTRTIKSGKIELYAPDRKYVRESIPCEKSKYHKILSKHILEKGSQTSSFLEVTGPKDSPSASTDLNSVTSDIEGDLMIGRLTEFFENEDYTLKSSSQSVIIEVQHYNESIDLRSTACIDIVQVNSQSDLAGISLENKSICLFDLAGTLIRQISCNTEVHRLAPITENKIVMISFTDPSVQCMNLLTETICDLQCKCKFDRCAISSQMDDVYVFCSGKHLHIYQSDEWRELHLRDIHKIKNWYPIYVCINADKTLVFVISGMPRILFCFDLQKGRLKFEESLNWEDFGLVIGGILSIGDLLFIFDKKNECFNIYTEEGFLYKDSLVFNGFNSCKLLTKGFTPSTLYAICGNNSKHSRGKLGENESQFMDVSSSTLATRDTDSMAMVGVSEGDTTDNKDNTFVGSHTSDLNDTKLKGVYMDNESLEVSGLSPKHQSEKSENTSLDMDVIYFLKVNIA